MRRVNPKFEFLAYSLISGLILISWATGYYIFIYIFLSLMSIALAGIILYLILQRFIDRISTVKSWSYAWDDKYSGYSIQANRSLLGISWSTNEYLSGSEEEAKRLTDLKNGATTMIMLGNEGRGNSYSYSDRQLFFDKNK